MSIYLVGLFNDENCCPALPLWLLYLFTMKSKNQGSGRDGDAPKGSKTSGTRKKIIRKTATNNDAKPYRVGTSSIPDKNAPREFKAFKKEDNRFEKRRDDRDFSSGDARKAPARFKKESGIRSKDEGSFKPNFNNKEGFQKRESGEFKPKFKKDTDFSKKKDDSYKPKFTKEGGFKKKATGDFKPRFTKDVDFVKKEGSNFRPKYKKVIGRNAEDLAPSDGSMRLNRFLAIAGIASRREADELIRTGLVMVNGKVITEMGHRVMPTDDVRYNGTRLKAERKVYILLNKPKGYITTVEDPKARKTVMDLINHQGAERFYPVGRLDRATTGLLLFTNDGDLAKKLTHPSHGAKKIYHIVLDKPLTKGDLTKIANGLVLEDGPAQVDAISFIDDKANTNVGMEIHMGKNRIVRRIFEHLGYEVEKLDRVMFAGLTKKNLARGQWRYLNDKEVSFLQML